jgi:hypothetical protein
VSHFSSNVKSIKACVELLREARCSLDVSFASYKNLIAVGESLLCMSFIQCYFSVISAGIMWIYVQGCSVPISWALTMAKPAEKLAPTRPTARLLGMFFKPFNSLGVETMISVIGQMIISFIILVASVFLLFSQAFLLCNELDDKLVEFREWWTLADNYEASTTGMIMAFQILHVSAAYNLGTTYRQGFLKNRAYLAMYALFFAMLSFMLLANPNPLGCIFRIKYVALYSYILAAEHVKHYQISDMACLRLVCRMCIYPGWSITSFQCTFAGCYLH